MATGFLVTVAIMLGFIAATWKAEGWLNIALKLAYTIVTVWAAGLAVVKLGWLA